MNAIFGETAFHAGEENIQKLLRVPYQENPTVPFLPPGIARFISASPLVAVGTTSASGQPWASLLTGIPGFTQNVGQGILAIQTAVPIGDPLYDTFGNENWDENADEADKRGEGMIAGLAVNLERRQRVKFYGKSKRGMRRMEKEKGMVTFVMQVEQTLGNCPKYMNARHLEVVPVDVPTNLTDNHVVSASLPQDALDLISRSDMFFVASRNEFTDMDVNHRGGPPGFVRVVPHISSNSDDAEMPTTLIWPEYSGNRLYQTLGNLQVTPLAGLTFPDYNTGDMLYLTGAVEILIGDDAEKEMNRSKLAVKFTVIEARYIKGALGLRLAKEDDVKWSPYNPMIRYLTSEPKGQHTTTGQTGMTARLLKKEKLADTVARFTFQLSGKRDKSQLWRGGQYVMLNFEDEMSAGYRHMDDSDPQGLNDDYIRSFTVSSPPDKFQGKDDGKFELTIRKVGPVTRYLFQQNPGAAFEVPVQGFGGDFFIEKCEGGTVGMVAAGVGITPFIAQWKELHKLGLDAKLFWTVKEDDLKFVMDIVGREDMEGMKDSLRLFITGGVEKVEDAPAKYVEYRRMEKGDLVEEGDELRKWYICTGESMRKQVVNWLEGEKRQVHWEEFTY
ncbi:hypothetical protein TWF694_011476 [Orbilia ellipsospora]|uniref:FAD-binding FR-type domain-containing protein n=1 Tax=Orbilia ellipsospora TaxID=2528407 RepID=A0AAV9X5P6_9PEZI